MTPKEIEDAYNDAARGTAKPEVVIIHCPECDVTFTLVRGEQNAVCAHLEEKMKAQSQPPPISGSFNINLPGLKMA